MVKNPPAKAGDAGDPGLTPGSSERSPGEGSGNPLQYSCLKNTTERGAWQTAIDSASPSQTRLKRLKHTHVLLYSVGNYFQYPLINHNEKEYEKDYIYN